GLLNIRFLGTGAAEGIPSLGCTCQRCRLARKEGGINVRKQVVHFTDSSYELSDLHRYIAKEADLVIFHTPTFETNRNHLSVQNVISLVKDSSSKQAIITHINHNNLSHAELVERVEPWGITVAYDGLTMEV
ncbi:unnamed protein product, partial [marine sediment metagenome]